MLNQMQHLIMSHDRTLTAWMLPCVFRTVAQSYAGGTCLREQVRRSLLTELEHLPGKIADFRLSTFAAADFEPIHKRMGIHTDDRFELRALGFQVTKLLFGHTILYTLGIPGLQPPEQLVGIDGDYLVAILYLNSHILNRLRKNDVKAASAVFLGSA